MHESRFHSNPDPVSDAFIIYNPAAGTRDRSREVGIARDYLEKRISRVEFCETEGPGHATQLTIEAREQGFKHVVGIGGDGHLREIGAGAVNSDMDVTLLSTGSEEMGRRVFKTPQNLLQAAGVLFDGRVQLVDTGTVNGELFIFNAGVGADADVVHGVQKPGFKKDGHGLKVYFTQAKNILPRVRGVSAKLTIEDGTTLDKVTFFTPNLYQFWAINARMLARLRVTNGEIDDGEYDILLGFADRLSQLVFPTPVALATGRNNSRCMSTIASNIDIDLSRARNAQVDGDPMSSTDRREVRMNPGSLRLRVVDEENDLYGMPPIK